MWLRDWSELQQQYYYAQSSRRSGKLWMSKVIRKLWKIAWQLWTHRNQALHDTEEHRARVMVLASIQAIYRAPRNHLPPQVQRHFLPWPVMSAKPLAFLEAWLEAYKAYKEYYSTRARQRTRRVQRSLGL